MKNHLKYNLFILTLLISSLFIFTSEVSAAKVTCRYIYEKGDLVSSEITNSTLEIWRTESGYNKWNKSVWGGKLYYGPKLELWNGDIYAKDRWHGTWSAWSEDFECPKYAAWARKKTYAGAFVKVYVHFANSSKELEGKLKDYGYGINIVPEEKYRLELVKTEEARKEAIEVLTIDSAWLDKAIAGKIDINSFGADTESAIKNINSKIKERMTTYLEDGTLTAEDQIITEVYDKLEQLSEAYEYIEDPEEIEEIIKHTYTGDYHCNIFGDDTWEYIKKFYTLIKIAIPALIIVLGMLDFLKVVFTGEEKDMKISGMRFLKRIIAGIVFILLPVLLRFLMNVVGFSEGCLQELL